MHERAWSVGVSPPSSLPFLLAERATAVFFSADDSPPIRPLLLSWPSACLPACRMHGVGVSGRERERERERALTRMVMGAGFCDVGSGGEGEGWRGIHPSVQPSGESGAWRICVHHCWRGVALCDVVWCGVLSHAMQTAVIHRSVGCASCVSETHPHTSYPTSPVCERPSEEYLARCIHRCRMFWLVLPVSVCGMDICQWAISQSVRMDLIASVRHWSD